MKRTERLPRPAALWPWLMLSILLIWAQPLGAQTGSQSTTGSPSASAPVASSSPVSWESQLPEGAVEGSQPTPAQGSLVSSLSSPALEISLSQAVQEALAQHPRVRAALAQLRAAEAGLEATQAEIKGSFRVEGTAARRKLSSQETPAPGSHGQTLSAALIWSGSLWDSPTTEAALEAGRAEVVRAQGEARHAVQQVVIQTAQAYLNLLQAQDGVEVARLREEWAAEALRVTQRRFEAGEATETDVLQAMAQWQQARAEQQQALQGQRLAAQQLLNWMGRPLGAEPPRVIDPLEDVDPLLRQVVADLSSFLSVNPGVASLRDLEDLEGDGDLGRFLDLDKAVALARARRSEVALLEQQLQAARAALRATETEKQPTVGLSASYRWPDTELSVQLNRWGQGIARLEGAAHQVEGQRMSPRAFDDWTIGVQVGWTLDDGGRTKAREAQGQARIQAIEASLEELMPGLRLEVEAAVHTLRQAYWNQQVAQTRLEASQSLLARTQQLMDAGAAAWSDVLQARFVAEGARAEWRTARWQMVVAQLNLALTTGWQPPLDEVDR